MRQNENIGIERFSADFRKSVSNYSKSPFLFYFLLFLYAFFAKYSEEEEMIGVEEGDEMIGVEEGEEELEMEELESKLAIDEYEDVSKENTEDIQDESESEQSEIEEENEEGGILDEILGESPSPADEKESTSNVMQVRTCLLGVKE